MIGAALKTDAARRAQAKYAAKLADSGEKPLTVMLTQAGHKRIEALAISYGSKRAVIEALLSTD